MTDLHLNRKNKLISSNLLETKPSTNVSSSDSKRLIDKINKKITHNEKWFSVEFFPPKEVNETASLIQKIENLAVGNPLFCNITWRPNDDSGNLDNPTSSMKMAYAMLKYCLLETILHITCSNQTLETIKVNLEKAKLIGIRNLLVLRGDPEIEETELNHQKNYFNYAVDLVKFIRSNYGDYFVICVAGYPEKHPDSNNYEEDLNYLKEKVNAGADFIISQLFFKAETFIKFFDDCRRIGINCPIIPCIFPVQSINSLRHMCTLSKLCIPKNIEETMDKIKENEEAILNYGINLAVELCKSLLNSNRINGLHFFTLNRDFATTEILKQIGLWRPESLCYFPWKNFVNISSLRESEIVRPIFWKNRPKSYVCRTSFWNKFQIKYWENTSLNVFSDLKDYNIFYSNTKESKELLNQWGHELYDEKDIWHVFECFNSGETNKNGFKVNDFPWYEKSNSLGINNSSCEINKQMSDLNRKGILTINSQLNVNGISSSDIKASWGLLNGLVYQKAYLEFFTSDDNLNVLLNALSKHPSVSYQILNKSGEIDLTNVKPKNTNTVAWVVFPDEEIIQTAVVDPVSFLFWKNEAFSVWTERWGRLYNDKSKSRMLIEHVEEKYILVYLVDNNYTSENCIFNLLSFFN